MLSEEPSPAQQINFTDVTLIAEFEELVQNETNATVEALGTVGILEQSFPAPSSGLTEMVEAAKVRSSSSILITGCKPVSKKERRPESAEVKVVWQVKNKQDKS